MFTVSLEKGRRTMFGLEQHVIFIWQGPVITFAMTKPENEIISRKSINTPDSQRAIPQIDIHVTEIRQWGKKQWNKIFSKNRTPLLMTILIIIMSTNGWFHYSFRQLWGPPALHPQYLSTCGMPLTISCYWSTIQHAVQKSWEGTAKLWKPLKKSNGICNQPVFQ